MAQKKKLWMIVRNILICLLLAGCGSGGASLQGGTSESAPAVQEQGQKLAGEEEPQPAGTEQGQSSDAGNEAARPKADDGYKRGDLIEEQTFEVTLRPLGQVTFAAYEPDRSENPLADVVFLIEKDGEVLMQLPGTDSLEFFNQVEAVSFPDYNNDSYDDIILIISYYFGAGPQAATPHSVIRYYEGTAEGSFVYRKEMSEDASLALTEITIRTAENFISGERADSSDGNSQGTESSLEPWQQAYIQYLSDESEEGAQQGYTLITMSDDGIPQLVEVGIDEATGCRVIHYADGKVCVTQLNRLYFSYIPGENLLCNSEGLMDYYYDLVYRIIDGEMTLIASGYYGAEDNSKVQFDGDGNPVYQYEWNGVKVSGEEEYQKELSKVYDVSKAVSYDYSNLYSIDEIKNIVEGYLN